MMLHVWCKCVCVKVAQFLLSTRKTNEAWCSKKWGRCVVGSLLHTSGTKTWQCPSIIDRVVVDLLTQPQHGSFIVVTNWLFNCLDSFRSSDAIGRWAVCQNISCPFLTDRLVPDNCVPQIVAVQFACCLLCYWCCAGVRNLTMWLIVTFHHDWYIVLCLWILQTIYFWCHGSRERTYWRLISEQFRTDCGICFHNSKTIFRILWEKSSWTLFCSTLVSTLSWLYTNSYWILPSLWEVWNCTLSGWYYFY